MQIAYTDPANCTAQTCDIHHATVHYFPNLGANAFYLSWFALLLIYHVVLGVKNRTWGFLTGMSGGFILEIIGYAARIQMHFNPWLPNPFLIYIVCLTIGPVFFAGSIYICFTRIVQAYGEEHARFKPSTYTKLFIGSDILALVLQAVGGAIADTAITGSTAWTGIHIMIAGLALQVVSLTIYFVLGADFAWRVRKSGVRPKHLACSVKTFHLFLAMLAIAALAILIRSVYRVVELAGGFGGKVANEEIPFLILEGTMISIAVLLLSVVHPGKVFGENWSHLGAVNDWFKKKARRTDLEKSEKSSD